MEQNGPAKAKKLWHIVRVAFFMLKKNISKRKLLLDLKYLTMKRPKLAGKSFAAVGNLTLHQHHDGGAYEFSCSNTPKHPYNIFPFHFNLSKQSKQAHHHHHYYNDEDYSHAPTKESEMDAVNRVLEMMVASGNSNNPRNDEVEESPYPYSPLLPEFRFWQSPMVRQLRVTDSPYPLQSIDEGNYRVDEAAEEFIQRFYHQLRQQSILVN